MNKEQRGGRPRFSLSTKNLLVFIGLFVLMIALMWLINRFFLPDFYLKTQLSRMAETRQLLEEIAENNSDDALLMEAQLACERNGVAVIMMRSGEAAGASFIAFSSGGEERGLLHQVEMELREGGTPETQFLEKTAFYYIRRGPDPMTKSEKITCLGTTEAETGKYYYLISLPLARLAESAAISNRFLLWIGLGVLLLGSILTFFLSRRLIKPLVSLTDISRRMASLDFSERFMGRSRDEVQILGDNINNMADTLENTISDLKNANLALERDVQEKEEENARRKELLSGISHELKTPIALIQGYAEGLRDGMCESEETRQKYSDIIIDEASRMNRLVRQMLQLSEMESGMAAVEKSSFDLSELIRQLAGSFALDAENKNARLELDVPPQLYVETDEFLIEQVVQNYLSNAFHHVSRGGLIKVSAGEEEGKTCITVYNEGESIPPEALPKIWDKFYKVDKARTRSYGGSGIGLSLVKAAMDLLGGSCLAENQEKGVAFKAKW